MKLDTLYKRTRTGAIQFWSIMVEKHVDGTAAIIKESGQLGTTNPLLHTEHIKEGKNIGKANETTPVQQAESQAQSDWKKKRDEGYKSGKDLGITSVGLGYITVNDGEKVRTLEAVLDETLGRFNTDASGNVKPMLAPTTPFKVGKTKYPQIIETKFDGVRATCILDPEAKGVQFLSRSGKPYTTMTHLTDYLEDYLVNHPDIETLGKVILDGELYLHGLLLSEINEAVKKNSENTDKIEFWVYDLPLSTGNQAERSQNVRGLVELIGHPQIKAVTGTIARNDEDVKSFHDGAVQSGYEGAMLKDPAGVYQQGQRSRYWTKVKMFDDNEFEIVGFKLGQRGTEDLLIVCKLPDGYDPVKIPEGTVDVKMMGTRESKQKLYDQKDSLIGKQLTVKHFGFTKYGAPFLPVGKAIRDND
jgi:DNA ligase-1